MQILRFAACLLLASLPMFSSAQEAASACRADAGKFCSQEKGGRGKIMDCLIDHQKDLSDACYDAMKTLLARRQDAQACKQDAEQFCKGQQPGGGRIVNCLIDHQKEISDACYDALKTKRGGSK
jgi:hypothetical protein